MVQADCAAATARFVDDRQARCFMFFHFPPRVFKRFIRTAAGGCRTHNFFDENFRGEPVVSSHAAAYIAFGYDADQI